MPQITRKLFEEEICNFIGVPHAIAVNSGTSALVGALWSMDLQHGDEVITTPFTFMSTANAIVICGGTPVFVDIREDNHLINEELIEKAITPNTKAILPVHLFGRTCNMNRINKIANKYNLVVIEDAAQSFGTEYKGCRTGAWGDAGCFSFYKTKNLSTFEGGAIVIKEGSRLDAEKIRAVTDPQVNVLHGKYFGFNFRMPEPCALVGYERLKMHRKSILAELGTYSEKNGFYKNLIYEFEAFKNIGAYDHCPVAEKVVKEIQTISN